MRDATTDDARLPNADGPGGAHAKGYGADPKRGRAVPDDDPIPLASDEDVTGHVCRPGDAAPTGRDEAEGAEKGRILGGGA